MNNFDVTQKIILEKMLNYTKKNSVGDIVSESEMNNLDIAFRYLNTLIDAQQITSARPVLTRKKGLLGKLAILFKKVVRKAIFWYVEPICKSQTYCNEMATQVMIRMFYHIQSMSNQSGGDCQDEISSLSAINEQLKRDAIEFSNRNNELTVALEQLKEKCDELNKRCERQSIQLELLQEQNDKAQSKLLYVSEETRKVVEDMQIVKREAGELFKVNGEDFWNKVTVAQSGEDSIIAYILMVLGVDLSSQYYLDLGANHAKQLSNTYMLYQKGMRGVLVEANPKLADELRFFRNEDIVLNKCIANEAGIGIEFYILNGDGLSSMDLESVNDAIAKNPALHIEKTIMVDSITINEIMENYFTKAPLVMNVDVEGLEEDILRALDYEKYAPLIIVVERIEYDTTIATGKRKDNIADIMSENGYFEYAFTGINSIFVNKARLEEIKNENRI